tara:strand:+ start:27472 stop:28176 length:705 start_codon:yes stop_codon:yes gene_type:complete
MALPKINSAPKYEITIPSTQKTVRYRPYLVKEEKILMMAMETQDQKQALAAIVDTIESCVEEPIERNRLTTFDVEYLFTQIRSKSVGETAKIGMSCQECETTNEISVPLTDVNVKNLENQVDTIELTPEIKLKMKWPSFSDIIITEDMGTGTEQTFKLIGHCIDSVQTPTENIRLSDETEQEVQEFIESLSSAQFNMIREHVDKIPRMEYDIEFTCQKCNAENKVTLSGISDFF